MAIRARRLGFTYTEAYGEYIDLVLSGEPFDYTTTKLWQFVERTKMRRSKVDYITRRVPNLIRSIKDEGIKDPLEISGDEVITGNQRLAIAIKFGIKEVECFNMEDNPKRKKHE